MYYKVIGKKERARQKKKKRFFGLFILLLSVAAVLLFLFYNMVNASPTIKSIARTTALNYTTRAVNNAIYTVLSEGISYKELIAIEKNVNNEIVMISANTVLINRLAKETAVNVQDSVNSFSQIGIEVPWGTLTGFPIMTGKGSNVSLSVSPISTVLCSFESSFKSAGINQTLHQIYLNVSIDMYVMLPTEQTVVNIVVPVMLTENLIVGKVPDVFLSGTVLGSAQSA